MRYRTVAPIQPPLVCRIQGLLITILQGKERANLGGLIQVCNLIIGSCSTMGSRPFSARSSILPTYRTGAWNRRNRPSFGDSFMLPTVDAGVGTVATQGTLAHPPPESTLKCKMSASNPLGRRTGTRTVLYTQYSVYVQYIRHRCNSGIEHLRRHFGWLSSRRCPGAQRHPQSRQNAHANHWHCGAGAATRLTQPLVNVSSKAWGMPTTSTHNPPRYVSPSHPMRPEAHHARKATPSRHYLDTQARAFVNLGKQSGSVARHTLASRRHDDSRRNERDERRKMILSGPGHRRAVDSFIEPKRMLPSARSQRIHRCIGWPGNLPCPIPAQP